MLRRRSTLCLVLAVLALAPAGCSKWNIKKPFTWNGSDDADVKEPNKVVATWTDTVLYQGDKQATRGFGGRLMFYGGSNNQPIKVDGGLVVYAFEETNRKKENTRPDRKYVFTAEQFGKHYSKSQLGHSYSVWLPWDEAGGEQTKISLIIRFMPAKGSVVIGEQTTHLLPGKKTEVAETVAPAAAVDARKVESGVRQASLETPLAEPNANGGAEAGKMKTHTIAVPSRSGLLQPGSHNATNQKTAAAVSVPQDSPAASNAAKASQPAGRSEPSKSRVLGAPIVRPRAEHAQSPPRPSMWRSHPEPQPESATGS